MSDLNNLVTKFLEAKQKEQQAKAERERIETEIIAITGHKEEGAQSVKLDNGMTLTVTGKLNYSADMEQLLQICERIPENLRPIKTETKLDETGAKYLRKEAPEVWRMIAPALTIKPAKTSIAIKA